MVKYRSVILMNFSDFYDPFVNVFTSEFKIALFIKKVHKSYNFREIKDASIKYLHPTKSYKEILSSKKKKILQFTYNNIQFTYNQILLKIKLTYW